ncbi:MAG: TIGR02391 family protein [Candidatus Peregrinibacteria bacterium]
MPKKLPQIPFPEFHPTVNAVAKSLYESGHYTEALRSASIRLEERCKELLKERTGDEETGTTLMAKLFCEKEGKVICPMTNLSAKDGADKQKAFYFLFSGFAGVIRNTLAHSTTKLDDLEALYGLNIASYLFYKLDSALKNNAIGEEKQTEPGKEAVELINEAMKNFSESALVKFLLRDEKIKIIPTRTDDQGTARLLVEKNVQDILTEQIEEIGEGTYNEFFSDADLQSKIYSTIIQKLYE